MFINDFSTFAIVLLFQTRRWRVVNVKEAGEKIAEVSKEGVLEENKEKVFEEQKKKCLQKFVRIRKQRF